MKRSLDALRRLAAWLVLAPIRAYSRFISPALPRRCKYHPTCSDYAQRAVRTHGVARGTLLASWRLLRCNPWSQGGVDDVPEPGDWRAPFHRPFSHDPEARQVRHTHGAGA